MGTQTKTLAEQVADGIMNLIQETPYKAGDKLPTEKELSKIYLYGGRIVKNSESGSAYALRAPEAMLYMAGCPVIDGGLYLTSYGESDYYAGCPYGYIVFTGDFTGTFELYRNNPLPYQALAGSSYYVDYFYQYVGYSASGVRVDTSGISCRRRQQYA